MRIKQLFLILYLSFISSLSFAKGELINSNEKLIDDENVIAILNEKSRSEHKNFIYEDFYRLSIESIYEDINLGVRFVEFETVEEIKQALDTNFVDFALYPQLSTMLDDKYIYSNIISESSITYWTTQPLNEEVSRWVCVTGSIYCEVLEKTGFEDIQYVKSFYAAIQSVLSKDRDAVLASYITLSSYLNASDELKGTLEVPEWGGVITTRLMANADKNKLISKINNKIRNLYSSNPYYKMDLTNIDFKKNHRGPRVIKYSFNDDIFPLLFRDQNGNLTGYLYDILKLIESRTELRFEFVKKSKTNNLSEMLTLGEIDLIPYSLSLNDYAGVTTSTDTIISFRYYGVSLSSPDKKTKNIDGVLLAQSKEDLGIKKQIFGSDVLLYSSPKSILKGLELGDIEKAYIREDIIDIIASSDANDNYLIDRRDYKTVDAVMTVSIDNPLLMRLLNNSFKTWDDHEIQKIKNSYDPFNVVYGFDYQLVVKAILAFIVIIVIFGFLLYLWINNLNLQYIIKERDAKEFEIENKFLQSVITQFPSQVFIYNEVDDLLLSSCKNLKFGKCDGNGCQLRVGGVENKLLLNGEIRGRVLSTGESVKKTVDITNCTLGIDTVEYICKRVTANDKNYILTIINDISIDKQQERELILAKQKAEDAISTRDKFLASMSHELRTPIAGMVGLLEMLSNKTTDEEDRVLLSNVSSSARQLNVLVNDILDFSKLEAKQLKLDSRQCDILHETGEIVRIHQTVAHEKGLILKYYFAPTTIKIISFDSLRYGQILNNLLSNAIKFTEQGEVAINVRVDIDSLNISIIDSGCGMSSEQQKHIFSPFVQADNSIARKYGGTGLGLSIVSELTNLMGGKLAINSEEGVGTKVELMIRHEFVSEYSKTQHKLYLDDLSALPIVSTWLSVWGFTNGDTSTNKVLICKDIPSSLSTAYMHSICLDSGTFGFKKINGNITTLSRMPFFPDLLLDTLTSISEPSKIRAVPVKTFFEGSVLVAEDNPINQLVIRKQLNTLGLDAHIFNNGAEALEALKSSNIHYHLLVTDCHMPIMDGFELVKKIREMSPKFDSLKIIGCTAEDSRLVHDTARLVGFDRVLYKPYGLDKLCSTIDDLFLYENKPNDYWLDLICEQEVTQLKQVFIKTMSDDLAELNQISEKPMLVKKLAHRIKGGASILGIESIVLAAKEVESKIETTCTVKIEALIDPLIRTIVQHIALAENYTRGDR